jgi:hypothetical protein
MNLIKLPFTAIVLVASHAQAAESQQFPFVHHDWEIACDNTRTCRAAGYQADDAERGVSVLLTRRAGPAAPVQAELQLEATGETIPERLRMRIDGKDYGETTLDDNKRILSPVQTAVLVNALSKATRLAWAASGKSWRISLKGINAVLLKMDEFQGRLDTPGALIRKGQKPESSVLPALPVLEFVAVRVVSDKAEPKLISVQQRAVLFAEIRKTFPKEETSLNSCEKFDTSVADSEKWTSYRLSDKQLLVSAQCWSAAYNTGDGYWVVNAQPPYAPVYVTNLGVSYLQGTISSYQRGRGIGDCISKDSWTWDGRRFVHTGSMATGMCKHIAPEGAWELPTLVTKSA